jgi:hypothetical protein
MSDESAESKSVSPVRISSTGEIVSLGMPYDARMPIAPGSLHGLGGVYCENVEVARIVPPDERSGWASDDSTRKVGVMPHSIDPTSADRLWALGWRVPTIKGHCGPLPFNRMCMFPTPFAERAFHPRVLARSTGGSHAARHCR